MDYQLRLLLELGWVLVQEWALAQVQTTVLVLAFWSFRTPALLLVALGVAMAWSFG